MPYYQSNAVVNYPCNYDFTRIHEYKYYLNDLSAKTVIAKEYSEAFERGKMKDTIQFQMRRMRLYMPNIQPKPKL